MHRRAIQCNTCGKSFFPASLKFHIPQCIKKQQHLPIPCRYCDQEIKQMDMQVHLKHCSVAKQKMREEKRRRATKGINRAFAKHDTKEQRRLAKMENYTQLSERAARESRNLTNMYTLEDDSTGRTTGGLIKCACCGRSFAAARIATHQGICRKSQRKPKRRVFNSTKQRLEGTDQTLFYNSTSRGRKPSISSRNKKPSPSKMSSHRLKSPRHKRVVQTEKQKVSNWREQSRNLRAMIKQSKLVDKAIKNGDDLSLLPMPPQTSSQPSNFIECPTCHRTFNPQSGERHIAKCKSIINKPKTLLRGSGGGSGMGRQRHGFRRVPRTSPVTRFGEKSRIDKNKSHTTFGPGRQEGIRPVIHGNKDRTGEGGGIFYRENLKRGPIKKQGITRVNKNKLKSSPPSFVNSNNTFGGSRGRFGDSGRTFRNGNSGGVIASNATSKNNPMLTNRLQAIEHPFGKSSPKVFRS